MKHRFIKGALAFLLTTAFLNPARASELVSVEPPSADVEAACDEIIARLVERYGPTRRWRKFPVRFPGTPGGSIAGYTRYESPYVREVVIYEPPERAVGGTLDHELTHAFFFYWLDSNFDLFLNEGAAQNSESRNRARLRSEVWSRRASGRMRALSTLYGRNSYDSELALYSQGFSVVDFLLARGGSKWFAAFLDDLTHGTGDVDASLRRFYGYASLEALEEAWLEYVDSGQDRSTAPPVR